jgi:hypothetical protein
MLSRMGSASVAARLRCCRWGLLLAALLGAHLAVHTGWLALHADPTLGEVKGWDTRWHLRNCAVYHGVMRGALESGEGAWSGLADSISALSLKYRSHLLNHLWPRLSYLAALPAALVFGASGRVYEMNNALWLVLLLVSVYLLGKRCAGPPAGLLAAFLTSSFPGVFGLARRFELDLPLTAMVALTMLLLVRTDGFRRRAASVVVGLVAGLGILVKAQLVLFLLPALCVLADGLSRAGSGARAEEPRALAGPPLDRRARLEPLLHAALAALHALAISAVWWWGGLDYLHLGNVGAAGAAPGGAGGGLAALLHESLFYASAAAECCGPLLLLLSVPGIVLALRDRRVPHRALLGVWLFGAYLLLSLLGHKLQRFFLPALPALALLTAVGLVGAWRGAVARLRVLARGLVAGIAVVGSVQLVGVSFFEWGPGVVWTWAETAERALAGPEFDKRIRSNQGLWGHSTPEERAREHHVLDLVEKLLDAAPPRENSSGTPRPVRIGAVGRNSLSRLELPLALNVHDAFSFTLLAASRSAPEGSRRTVLPDWRAQLGPEVDARDLDEAPRTDYLFASEASPVSAELERATRERLEKEDRGCPRCALERRARIDYIRRCFTRVVARRAFRLDADGPEEPVFLLRNTCPLGAWGASDSTSAP